LLFLLVTLGLLLGVVWWQLPAVLNWGLTRTLQQNGLTNVNLKIREVGVFHTSINRLDLTYPDGDTTVRVELGDLSLEYTLSQLLAGHAESLIIDSIALRIDNRASPKTSTTSTLPTIEQLLSAYRAMDISDFPLSTVSFPKITVSHNLASESETTFDTINLQVDLAKHAKQLKAEVLFSDQQRVSWLSDQDAGWTLQYFDAPAQASSILEVETQKIELQEPIFNGSLNLVDQSLVFTADIKSHLLQRWLPPELQNDSSVALSDLAFQATIGGNNPASGLAMLLTIEMPNLGYQDWRIDTLAAQFDIQAAQAMATFDDLQTRWQIQLASNNTISIASASLADWQADTMALSLNSEANLNHDLSELSELELQVSVGKLQNADGLDLSETSFVAAASARMEGQKWQFQLEESWKLTSQYSRLDDTELPQGWTVSATRPLNLTGDVHADFDALIDETALAIAVPMLLDKSLEQRVQSLNASLQIAQARLTQGELLATGVLAIPQLTIEDTSSDDLLGGGLRLDNVRQPFELIGEVLISNGSLQSIERDLHIDTNTQHNLRQRQGRSRFRFKPLSFDDSQRLKKLVAPAVAPISLVAGELDLSGEARWRAEADEWQTTVNIDAQLNNLGGAYDEAYFSGANGQLSLQVYPDIESKKKQRLSVAQLDAGVENKDLVFEFGLRPSSKGDLPIVDILTAQTQLLQGSVKLKPTAYDLNQQRQTLQLVLENIDLNELVTLQQLDDVQATGRINGVLPIIINNDQISIDDGQMQALAPGGVLRYQANTDAIQSNKYAETVVLVLRNFHYDALQADTQYQPDGTLILALQLQGNNPDFEQGRQINLNINLEQNVLKLLESLRLYDGVSDKLDKRVRDFYQQTTSQ